MSDQIQMDRIDVGGIRIAYRRAGMGPPLVLLHGGPSDSREWHYQLQGLSDEFAVVAWDMPGCGQSADPPEHFLHTLDYADCLAAFIEALGLRQPHVLGLSFGSGLALELYRWYPRFFFFQAEDGIRDWSVTGVQTCALPISAPARSRASG